MRILGFDPGLAIVGYGIIDSDLRDNKIVDFGVIRTPKEESVPARLAMIQDGVEQIFQKFNPDAIAIEELFFARNVTTAINVAQARGVILSVSIRHIGNLYEYTPLQIKQALTGYGRAEKIQIQEMVKKFLRLEKIPKPDDAADALAVALTHSFSGKLGEKFSIK